MTSPTLPVPQELNQQSDGSAMAELLEEIEAANAYRKDPVVVMGSAITTVGHALEAAREVRDLHQSGADNFEAMQSLVSCFESLYGIIHELRQHRSEFETCTFDYMTVEEEEVFTKLSFCTVLLAKAPEKLRYLKPSILEGRAGRTAWKAVSAIPGSKASARVVKRALKTTPLKTGMSLLRSKAYQQLRMDIEFAIDLATTAFRNLSTLISIALRIKTAGHFSVFLSHAGEDKETMAIPIWKRLQRYGITAFLDKTELRVGENANEAMEEAMQTTPIGTFIMSTEFAAKKWTMKELMCFLEREANAKASGENPPLLIPVFYRMGLNEWQEQNLFRRSEFATWGFVERLEARETSIKEVRESLRVLSRHTGIENVEGATNEATLNMADRRERLIERVVERIVHIVRTMVSQSLEDESQDSQKPDGSAALVLPDMATRAQGKEGESLSDELESGTTMADIFSKYQRMRSKMDDSDEPAENASS